MILFVPSLSLGQTIELSLEHSRHLKAKRISFDKAEITLSDGKYCAQVTLIEGKKSLLATYDRLTPLPARPIKLSLYFSVIKPDRMSWLIEKAVEIGVDRLVPLYSERAQRTHWGKSTFEHLSKVLISASTQSLQLTPPTLEQPLSLQDVRDLLQNPQDLGFYGDLNSQSVSALELNIPQDSSVHLFIGPEGGWSPKDLDFLQKACTPIFYPGPVLRAETACIVLSSMLQGIQKLGANKS